MTLAYRHPIPFLAPLTLLVVAVGACGGTPETTAAGGSGGASSSTTGGPTTGNGGDGGLFETNVGGSTTSTGMTSSSTSMQPDPSAPCQSPNPAATMATWSKKAGAAQVQAALGVAADPQGNVIVAGNYQGSIDWGTGALNSAGQNDAYVAKLDANGTAVWAKSFGDAQYHQYAQHLATDAQGNILVTGHFRGTINFGGGALADISNFFEDIFIAKLGPTGNHTWSKRYGDINNEEAQDIATDAQGNVIAVGAFQKTVNFGGGALVAEDDGFNGFVAKLNAAGDQQWAKTLGDTTSEQKTIGVATDGDGNVYIVGYHQGAIDLGGGNVTAAANEQNAYVAKISSNGSFVWHKSWPCSAATAVDVDVDAAGNVYVLGNFKGKITVGGDEFDAGVANDVFLVKLNSAGDHVWSKAFGEPNAADEATSLALDGDKPIVFGAFTNKIDFGGGALTSGGGYDVFYAKLDNDGCEISAAVYGGAMLQRGETLAIDGSGNILIAGSFDGTMDFGVGALTADATDAYVVKLKP
jgi:hypothetical protein